MITLSWTPPISRVMTLSNKVNEKARGIKDGNGKPEKSGGKNMSGM